MKLGIVVATSIVAVGLILVGAWSILDRADRQRDQVECIRLEVRAQAEGNATMAITVLDLSKPQDERTQAVRQWADDQAASAARVGRC